MFSYLVNPALALLITTALALPTPDTSTASALTEAQLVSIAPKSSSCATAQFQSECRTAAQAAGPIQASFVAYGINTPGEQAAILSTMAFESDEFQYQINHFPGVAGQGTRNMQSPKYNLIYAQSIPALGPYLQKVDTSDPKAVLNLLVTYINYDFGSAAWFLSTQCDQSVRSGLQSGSAAGFSAYIACIGTTATDAREQYYKQAMSALGANTS